MPELPEVETALRDLEPHLRRRVVIGCAVRWPRVIGAPSADEFAARLVGQRFDAFARRGKYMLFGLTHAEGDGESGPGGPGGGGAASRGGASARVEPSDADEARGDTLIVHLRMTGRLELKPGPLAALDDQPPAPEAHVHVGIALDDGRLLTFRDPRKFGRLWLVDDAATIIGRLGPEPNSPEFTAAWLAARLSGRRAPIKALLLDQSICAGIGNIYADEALFAARIHPACHAGALDAAAVARLHAAIRALLARAIARGGSTLGAGSTNYRRPAGGRGEFQTEHQVFRRTGQPCPVCGTALARMVVAQRSTHYCPHCQARATGAQ